MGMHVTDWLPTIVEGVAGLAPPAGLDGFNQWPLLMGEAASNRSEILLDLNPSARLAGQTAIAGEGALRMGRYKLIRGRTSAGPECGTCTPGDAKTPPYCPPGWVGDTGAGPAKPVPPPDVKGDLK